MFRIVIPPDDFFKQVVELIGGRAEIKRGFSLPPIHLHTIKGMEQIPTSVVRFGTDIPCLTNWGEPLLFGPGSIHDAHTPHEYIRKQDLSNAVDAYALMARTLLKAN
jgi:acetylornithine deacetylase